MLTALDMNLVRIPTKILRDILRLGIKDCNSLLFLNGSKISNIPLIKSGSLPPPCECGRAYDCITRYSHHVTFEAGLEMVI